MNDARQRRGGLLRRIGTRVVLAFTGLFQLTAHWVAASGRELGIRRAVGASASIPGLRAATVGELIAGVALVAVLGAAAAAVALRRALRVNPQLLIR